MPNSASANASKSHSDIFIIGALSAIVLFFIGAGFAFYSNVDTLKANSELIADTHESIKATGELLTLIKDAETGQRGYVLTGNESYLEPFNLAISQMDDQVKALEKLYAHQPERLDIIATVKAVAQTKFDELQQTIFLRREKGFDAALDVVATSQGKNAMDTIRNQLALLQMDDEKARSDRLAEQEAAHQNAVVTGVLTTLLGIVLAIVIAGFVRRTAVAARSQAWLQNGETELAKAVLGDPHLSVLGEHILEYLAHYLGAYVGAFFIREGNGFARVATYGVVEENAVAERFRSGESLLGQAVKDGKPFILNDVPQGYLTVSSSLGQGNPRNILIAPAISENKVSAVYELGFLQPVSPLAVELLGRISAAIAISVRTAEYRKNLQELLEETQRQAEELQTQSEELRVSNEELEEQSRVLKESQVRLEQQQAELEQTNALLEEQSHRLEKQRDSLEVSQAVVEQKAQELERASQYKSDFLANMSHELRTPLNSSLILAKLLGDNAQGNLTGEQVKFARTIESAGNDLLVLINDILDLSKIEAGHMEIFAEPLNLQRVMDELAASFEPIAQQKNLSFVTKIAKGAPKTVESDRVRLEQVLKNLISNAIKFTSEGSVEVRVEKGAEGEVRLSVKDTGIGIPDDQQSAIFEAFRQADGTISRKYGGTGLGLSISRELVKLLGGRIEMQSKAGQGSIFSVVLPLEYVKYEPSSFAMPVVKTEESADMEPFHSDEEEKPVIRRRRISDDRDVLTGDSRVLLVVEDDENFAGILYSLSQELGLHCIIATSAEEGLATAKQYAPSAIVLDVGLPDHSGLSVLDRLKRDPRTRHIPIHIVSASDYSQKAFSLGAAGYMLKPVKREELVAAFKNLESRFLQRMRRVLIVEDDPVQQDSVRKLLGSRDVETVGAASASECLALLKDEVFDCMVLDLSLPDASGYSLLESLSEGDAYSFPPVIVYTGRALSADEEQRLRKYSKSIIIKGAKSPERLLDEVTLFLHQMVTELPPEKQKMLETARNRDATLEGRHVLVVEDDIRNVYALTNILEPHGVVVKIARNGREALEALERTLTDSKEKIDLVLMDVMMPEMDGLTATHEIRKRHEWKKLPIITLTAKAMKGDQERCLKAGANDYMSKPLDVEKLLSLVRVWMPR